MIDISDSLSSVLRFFSSVFTRLWSLLTNIKIFTIEGNPFTLAHFLLGIFVLALIVSAFSVAVRISLNTERV